MEPRYIQCVCGMMLPATILDGTYGGYFLGCKCWSCDIIKRETGDFADKELLQELLKSDILLIRRD